MFPLLGEPFQNVVGIKIPLPPALPYVPHYPREVGLRGISFRCLWMNEEEEKCHKLKSVFFLCMALSVWVNRRTRLSLSSFHLRRFWFYSSFVLVVSTRKKSFLFNNPLQKSILSPLTSTSNWNTIHLLSSFKEGCFFKIPLQVGTISASLLCSVFNFLPSNGL